MITNINVNNINSMIGTPQASRRQNITTQYANPNDSIELSSTAQDFSTVLEVVAKTPDIREERISEIQSQIDSGNYNVSSQAIANKILSRF